MGTAIDRTTGTALDRAAGTAIDRKTGTAIDRITGTAIDRITGTTMEDSTMTLSERADALETQMSDDLNRAIPVRSALYTSGDRDPRLPLNEGLEIALATGRPMLMRDDDRLPAMPPKPTLLDFFELRLAPAAHVLQSAALAMKAGCADNVVLACLLHDIAVLGFIRGDHGYWGAQLVAPYVSEEVSWAIRAHQVLRFYPDPAYGYDYPEAYVKCFGADFQVEPYVERAYQKFRNHRWYGIARLVTVNDIYSFDPNAVVKIEQFSDIIARNFRQPEEGLGWDDSPSSHMWRTMNRPTRFL
jgi:hypothetical protein